MLITGFDGGCRFRTVGSNINQVGNNVHNNVQNKKRNHFADANAGPGSNRTAGRHDGDVHDAVHDDARNHVANAAAGRGRNQISKGVVNDDNVVEQKLGFASFSKEGRRQA